MGTMMPGRGSRSRLVGWGGLLSGCWRWVGIGCSSSLAVGRGMLGQDRHFVRSWGVVARFAGMEKPSPD